MAFRLVFGALQGKYICGIPSNASTNYIPVSSDEGKLMMTSSNHVHTLGGTSNSALNTSDMSANYKLAGIFVKPEYENNASSCSTFGSTSCKLWIQPLCKGDILEVNYSTGTAYTSGTSGDLHTTNIGMYYKPCFSTDSTTADLAASIMAYMNPTTGTNIMNQATGRVFRLIDYSTKEKTMTVMYDDPGFTT